MATTNMNWDVPVVGADTDDWGDLLNTIIANLDAHTPGLIYGLTLSTAGSSSTFGVAAGAASGMALASAYTKTTDAWALGTGNGALDTGSIANSTWYHVWLIQRSDTGVVDILVSTSATSPTMPANYDRKRRIGSMITDASAHWSAFSQLGDTFLWKVPRGDATSSGTTAGSTSAINITLSVPTGVQVEAIFNWRVDAQGGNSANNWVSSFDQTDTAPDGSTFTQLVGIGVQDSSSLRIRTNTSAQVRARFNNTTAVYNISTQGWVDRRGQ